MSTSMLRRQLKNIVQNFSEAEIKVREATSNDPWGPSSSLMAEISDLTYNVVACSEIMTMVWKRLNDSGKNWRHVYKAMTLLDYLLKTGSDRVAQQCNENIYVLQTLREFQFIDRDGKDQGVNVREKAKQLVTLLKDEEKLKEERAQALKTKEKMAQTTSASSTSPAPALNLANRPGGLQLGGVASLTSLTKAPESQAAGDETKSKEEADQAPQTEGGSSNLWGAPAAPADSSAPPAGSDPWGGPASSPPANSDPWGGSASSPPGESDPWGDGGTAANASSDPWGDSSKASNDPWGSSAAVSPPGGDPWGAGTASAGDPWGTGGGAPAADSTTSDPWGGPANGAGDQKLSDVTAGGGGEEGGGRGGAPASLDLSSISAALPAKKTPESFLGANASLVDLDSLVSSKPKPKQSGPSMASMVTKPSPFTQSQGFSTVRPPPSLPLTLPFCYHSVAPALSLPPLAMLEHMSRRSRSLLSLSLTSLALALSVLAFCTSYWCEGTHKVVKPLCLSPVKMKKCGSGSGQSSAGPTFPSKKESSSPSPAVSNGTVSQKKREELARIRQRQQANAVHYIWETGEDKYMLRYFHTGFWQSCEKHNDGEKCRSFIELTPGETQGVLWLSVVSEFMYISLLAMGFLLMWVEVLCACAHKEMYALKINAFAAICTVLSGMMGMVAHMMYTTVFQMTVSVGPKDWRPQTWDYGWSFALAWISFSCCMAAAVFTLNSYTKTVIEMKHRQRLRLEEARASHAPSYDEVVPGGGVYSVSGLMQCQAGLIDKAWAADGVGETPTLMLVGGCGAEGCVDCERELEEMEDTMERDTEREEGFSVSREEDGGVDEVQEDMDAFC